MYENAFADHAGELTVAYSPNPLAGLGGDEREVGGEERGEKGR